MKTSSPLAPVVPPVVKGSLPIIAIFNAGLSLVTFGMAIYLLILRLTLTQSDHPAYTYGFAVFLAAVFAITGAVFGFLSYWECRRGKALRTHQTPGLKPVECNISEMRLTPHQILQKLGFDVPADGVEMNPADSFLYDSILRMAGQSIDFGRIPDKEFEGLHASLAGLVAGWRGEPSQQTNARSVEITRTMANGVLALTFKHSSAAKTAA